MSKKNIIHQRSLKASQLIFMKRLGFKHILKSNFISNSSFFSLLIIFCFGVNSDMNAQCPATNLAQASDYALFTFGNFTCNQGDQVWGRAAVGGNFTVSNWGIGANGCLSNDAAELI